MLLIDEGRKGKEDEEEREEIEKTFESVYMGNLGFGHGIIRYLGLVFDDCGLRAWGR